MNLKPRISALFGGIVAILLAGRGEEIEVAEERGLHPREFTVAFDGFVTHNMQQAARCSDYTALMYLGRLIEFGRTQQIFKNPKEKVTEDYIRGSFG